MRFSWLLTAALFWFQTGGLFSATVIEDFNYPAATFGTIHNGGSGWNGAWGAGSGVTSTLRVRAENLSYTGGGYSISQTGTGLISSVYDQAFRGINRDIATPMSGTVYFSVLLSSTGAMDRSGIQFNNPRTAALDYNSSSFYVALNGSSLEVAWGNASLPTTAANSLALNSAHLIVGRIDIGAGNDALQLWVDSTNLADPGTPTYTVTGADLGADLFRAGVFAYGTSVSDLDYGRVDALRISDGNGDSSAAYLAVTGVNLVPEPQRAVLSLAALCMACFRRRRR